jgi:hypothetical protein
MHRVCGRVSGLTVAATDPKSWILTKNGLLRGLRKHPEITSQFFADIPPESALKNGNSFLDAA